MKVAVIGPGALGCLFAARLHKNGVKVHLVDHQSDRAERLSKSGVTVEHEGSSYTESPPVVTQIPTGLDWILVVTKAHNTPNLRFPPDTPVLTLQNGLGNVETLCSMLGSARVMAGATSEASTLLDEGKIHHVASGKTSFGAWTSCDCGPALETLRGAGFDADLTESPGQLIWEKVAINAGINPITAILNVKNGRLLELVEARQLMRDLVVEAAKVASTEGYRFDQSLVESAEDICAQTADNVSSMLQDVRNGKQTEIDAISGEIIRRATIASLPTPRTRVISQIVRSLERR